MSTLTLPPSADPSGGTTASAPTPALRPRTTRDPKAPTWLPEMTIDAVTPADHPHVAALLGRGMRDNPTHIAVFGPDPEIRRQRVERMFGAALPGLDLTMLAARRPDGAVVAVCGMAAPGACQPSGARKLRLLPGVFANGLKPGLRTLRWLGAWAKRDLPDPHWHVGPLAVDAEHQGLGIGTLLMTRLCAQMDAAGEIAYLETDKAINVRFYERFGFETVGEQLVLGTTNWFMRRAPRPVV